MKSLFRGSMATLVFASALFAAPTVFAQTEPRESDPVYPCGPPGSPNPCPGGTGGACSVAPGRVGNSGASGVNGANVAALAPFLIGLGYLGRRRRASNGR